MPNLDGSRVAFLVANEGIEQIELTRPWQAVRDAGGLPQLIAPKPGIAQAFNHLDKADTFPVDRLTSELDPDDYVGVVLPGGVANPDQLRMDEPAVAFLHDWCAAARPLAAICHGPWTLIEAGAVSGRTLTSWPSLQTDLRNAGATWVDRQVQVCHDGPGPIVTSRKPDDLDAFCEAFLTAFAGQPARH
ncbi:MAG TPA: type 1 glutamine amidotransferase domain-containing protein [Acidimicrobiia bacterium]|jgi:protease I|nr:type 1 glutamine amidotransferase domain-containing protein [Acidimicrobiia bacterium]